MFLLSKRMARAGLRNIAASGALSSGALAIDRVGRRVAAGCIRGDAVMESLAGGESRVLLALVAVCGRINRIFRHAAPEIGVEAPFSDVAQRIEETPGIARFRHDPVQAASGPRGGFEQWSRCFTRVPFARRTSAARVFPFRAGRQAKLPTVRQGSVQTCPLAKLCAEIAGILPSEKDRRQIVGKPGRILQEFRECPDVRVRLQPSGSA